MVIRTKVERVPSKAEKLIDRDSLSALSEAKLHGVQGSLVELGHPMIRRCPLAVTNSAQLPRQVE